MTITLVLLNLFLNFVQIQTKDGYVLGLQRVLSPSGDLRAQPGPPVLLQHGLFMVKFDLLPHYSLPNAEFDIFFLFFFEFPCLFTNVVALESILGIVGFNFLGIL